MSSRRPGSGFARVTGVAVAVLLATTMTPSYADEGPLPRPVDTPDGAAVDNPTLAAVEALETAEQVLSGKGKDEVDATLALVKAKQLAENLPLLQRNRAQQLLARPTDRNGAGDLITYPRGADVKRTCGAEVCVHWVEKGPHRPNLADDDSDGVPNFVETTLGVIEESWRKEVDGLGFRAPLGDGDKGGNAKLDAYLGNLGSSGVFGYANTDSYTGRPSAGYLVLDNNYTEFRGVPESILRATVAHEFFHLSQFAYSTREDTWFMEATASWMEEQVFDGNNDNRRYIPYSTLRRPTRSLDSDEAKYGNWVFFQHLSEAYGPRIVRSMWNRAAGKAYSIEAMQSALKARGARLQWRFSRFAVDSNMPGRTFSEGASYPKARVNRSWTLGRGQRATKLRQTRVNHLSSRNFVFRPGKGMGPKWRLRLRVDAATRRLARPTAVVHLRNGKIRRRPIRITPRGRKIIRVDFSRREVRKVTLNLANTSLRYRCNTNGTFSCTGNSKDDRKLFRFKATAERR